MELMLQPIRKYADFQGRARRSEYWFFAFGIFAFEIICGTLIRITGGDNSPLFWVIGILLFVVFLGVLVPSLALTFRRLHDTNRSACWILIGLLPILGALALLVFYCLDGTPGPNRFGPDPKGRGSDPTVFS